MPAIIALLRDKRGAGGVALVNFPPTVIGWLLALVWAFSGKTRSEKREEQRHQEMVSVARR